jgi:hypothetical protein
LANAKEALQRSPLTSITQDLKITKGRVDEKTKRYMASPNPQGLLPCSM